MQSPEADFHDLDRFVGAQERTLERALTELRTGRKVGHWMWFVFPQLAGLGTSETARRYAIRSLEEARAYMSHPALGAGYRQAVSTLQDLDPTTAEALLGRVDAAKLRSSLTLFIEATDGDLLLVAALQRWFGERDPMTLALLAPATDPAAP